ncbi:MAG TPA: CPBP family intramembrane glutamic endopeptidase [Patescibacteria group bacterium]|nr:CPBP family intramembrane glutamic endopeptidase [Patescibacteria group bacterium]
MIGLILANKLNLFIYNPSREFIKGSSKTVSLILFLSVLLVIANETLWVIYSKTDVLPAWVEGLDFSSAILISARAAIYEETFFRLFLMTIIIYFFKNIISYKKSVLIGIVVSALIFSVSFHSGSMISFASGLLLGFVFINTGIIPAMLLHFIADAVPFITIAYLLAM